MHRSAPGGFWGVGIGPVRQDRHGNDLLCRYGSFYQIHGGWRWSRSLGVRVDLGRVSIDHNDDIVFAPCPEPPADCPTHFLGPARVTVLSSAVEASWTDRRLMLLGSLGPSVYWLTERAPETRRTAGGLRLGVGGGYQLGPRLWAVLDVQYHQLFTAGNSPRWLLPASIGLERR